MLEVDLQKHFLIIGGAIGFILTFIVGFFTDNEMSLVLQNASIGCVVSAVLAKFVHLSIVVNKAEGGNKSTSGNAENKN